MGAILEMDADGDGDVDVDEFGRGLKALQLQLSEAEVKQVFAALDADGSGSVQPSELEALLFGRELTDAERAEMREASSREARHTHEQGAGHAGAGGDKPPRDKGSLRGSLMKLVPRWLAEVGKGAVGIGDEPPAPRDSGSAAAA